MDRVERLWLDYNTAYQDFRQNLSDIMEETEFLYDFLDNYFIYSSEQLKMIIALMDNFLIDYVDVENALENSDNIGMLAFLLSETYIYHRYDHEKRQREMAQLVEEIRTRGENNRPSQPITDEYPHEQEKEVYLYADFVDEDDIL